MTENEILQVWGYDFCIIDNYAYIFHGLINALFKVDLEDGTISYLNTIEYDASCEKSLYSSMVKWKEKIYLVPYNASAMVCYDIKSNTYRSVMEKEFKILDTFGKGRYVYLKPMAACNPILKFDLESEKVVEEVIVNNDYDSYLGISINDNCYMENGRYAVIITPINTICIIDSNNGEVSKISIQNTHDIYASIEYYDGYIYVMGSKEYTIAKIDPRSGEIIKVYKMFNQYGRLIGRISDEIIVDMAYSEKIYRFNCISGTIKDVIYDSRRKGYSCRYYWYCYGKLKKNNNVSYYFNRYNCSLVCNFLTSDEITHKLITSDEDYEIIKKYIVNDKNIYKNEDELVSLEDYLKYL